MRQTATSHAFVVTTSVGGTSKTQIWNPSSPLTVGHPLRWIAERTDDGVRIRDLSLKPGKAIAARLCEIPNERLTQGTEVDLPGSNGLSLRIRPASPQVIAYVPRKGHALSIPEHTEDFRKALGYTGAVMAALIALSWLWPTPKPDTQELIPPQFAKIILSKPHETQKSSASEGGPASAVPQKVANAAVVQAFRAKALSSAVSGLLKGGMTSLLAQSDFVAGKGAAAEAKKIFDTKSVALRGGAPASGISHDTNQKVASLGGSGGKTAGYGKGEHAGVKGQGEAFVSMDVEGAAVDEGLTKDEVGEVIHRHLGEVRYCYESAMARTPDLEGKLMAGFTIGGNGIVKSTEVKNSTLPDPRLDDCILRRLATWKFPNPRGGVDVTVSYPFIFKTLGH